MEDHRESRERGSSHKSELRGRLTQVFRAQRKQGEEGVGPDGHDSVNYLPPQLPENHSDNSRTSKRMACLDTGVKLKALSR